MTTLNTIKLDSSTAHPHETVCKYKEEETTKSEAKENVSRPYMDIRDNDNVQESPQNSIVCRILR